MRNSSWSIWILFASCLVLEAAALPALAQTSSNPPVNPYYTLGADPNLAGCGPTSTGPCHGSKLSANDSLIINAPISPQTPLPGNTGMGAPVCYSITNKTSNDYFVPWNKPAEWTAFLNAIGAPYQLANDPYTGPFPAPGGWVSAQISGSCCAPQTIGDICPDGSGPVSNTQLGYRYEGTPNGDQPYWGAQGDVYGPVYASVLNGDPNQTYRVTYVCSNGNWVQTHTEGSCLPVAGQCGAGTPGITSLPPSCGNPAASDYCAELCGPTSIFGGFTNAGGASSTSGWTWTCLGTPGQPPATCSSSSGSINGQCGSANGVPAYWDFWDGFTIQDYGVQLCANGTTPSAVSLPDQNIWNPANNPAETDVPNLYHWTCSGIGGSNVTLNCSAPFSSGRSAWGVAGAISTNTRATPPDPAADFLCVYGTPANITYTQIYDGPYNGDWGWTWSCIGPGANGWGFLLDSNAHEPGLCGFVNNTLYTSDTVPPASNLCDNYYGSSPSILINGPTFVLGSPSQWVWQCQGPNSGSIVSCGAT